MTMGLSPNFSFFSRLIGLAQFKMLQIDVSSKSKIIKTFLHEPIRIMMIKYSTNQKIKLAMIWRQSLIDFTLQLGQIG